MIKQDSCIKFYIMTDNNSVLVQVIQELTQSTLNRDAFHQSTFVGNAVNGSGFLGDPIVFCGADEEVPFNPRRATLTFIAFLELPCHLDNIGEMMWILVAQSRTARSQEPSSFKVKKEETLHTIYKVRNAALNGKRKTAYLCL